MKVVIHWFDGKKNVIKTNDERLVEDARCWLSKRNIQVANYQDDGSHYYINLDHVRIIEIEK